MTAPELRERVGNELRYTARAGRSIYPELASILRKTVGVADVLADALAPGAESITARVRSVARGAETAGVHRLIESGVGTTDPLFSGASPWTPAPPRSACASKRSATH